jgi:hypothetical protein
MIVDQIEGWLNNKTSVYRWWHMVSLKISLKRVTKKLFFCFVTLKTKFVTTPTLLPAPRTAQKRSVFSFSLAIKISPKISTVLTASIFGKKFHFFTFSGHDFNLQDIIDRQAVVSSQ